MFKFFKERAAQILLLLILFVVSLNIYSNRSAFIEPYDTGYMKDLYDHSQWILARSVRTMSDSSLYQVAGYDLVNTWEFFKINPEVPPLGKYMIGASIVLFNNPYVASLALYLLSLVIFYLIAKEVLANKSARLIAVLILAAEPMLSSQIKQSLLDLPQLVMLLIHVLALIKLVKNKVKGAAYYLWLLVAGMSLGAFVSIKIGFFAAAVLLADFVILLKEKRKWFFEMAAIVGVTGMTYIITFLPFFLSGHSIGEFITSQKWMVKFYFNSAAEPIFGLAFINLLTGWTKGWHEFAVWERITEWTVVWPLYLVFFFTAFISYWKSKKRETFDLYFLITTTVLLLLFSFITFFGRYLLLVIPFFSIFIVKYFPKKWLKALYVIVPLFMMQYFLYALPGPVDLQKDASRVWTAGTYQDLYDSLDSNTRQRISRKDFWRNYQKFERDVQISTRKVELKASGALPWQTKTKGDINISYKTPIGVLSNKQEVGLVRENNNWKILWDDKLIHPEIAAGRKMFFEKKPGRYGTLSLENGTVLTTEGTRPFFSVIQSKIENEENLQKQLFQLTGKKKFEQELAYKANTQIDWSSPIGFLKDSLAPEALNKFELDKGIVVDSGVTRVYSPSVIARKKVESVKYLEGTYAPRIMPIHGGVIYSMNGQRKVILEELPLDGLDIQIKNELYKIN